MFNIEQSHMKGRKVLKKRHIRGKLAKPSGEEVHTSSYEG